MDSGILARNWALIAAAVLVLFVAAAVVAARFRKSSYGRLRYVRADLTSALRARRKAAARSRIDTRRLQKLVAKSKSTKPRILQAAKESLEDAKALEKIADDKVMIAENHVRRVIHEEYPPQEQQRLREKYLSPAGAGDKPFSF